MANYQLLKTVVTRKVIGRCSCLQTRRRIPSGSAPCRVACQIQSTTTIKVGMRIGRPENTWTNWHCILIHQLHNRMLLPTPPQKLLALVYQLLAPKSQKVLTLVYQLLTPQSQKVLTHMSLILLVCHPRSIYHSTLRHQN